MADIFMYSKNVTICNLYNFIRGYKKNIGRERLRELVESTASIITYDILGIIAETAIKNETKQRRHK